MKSSSLKPKQIDILLLLYKFRYLTRPQLQTLLNHKHFNRIIVWLNDLTEKKYIHRMYTRELGLGHKPAVYCLDTKSKLILKDQKGVKDSLLKRVYRDKTRSRKFRDHSTLIADIYLSLLSLVKTQTLKLNFYTKTYLTGMKYLILTIPDCYFSLEENENTKRYFLEVIDEDTPRFALRKRIQQYLDYYSDELWQTHTKHPFPEVMIICPNESTKKFLNKFITEQLEDYDSNIAFYLATKDQVKLQGMKKEIWQKVE